MYHYPFGQPVTAPPPTQHPGGLLLLGDHPGALHVRWTAPDGTRITALPVGDEPAPFWDGADQADRIAAWERTTGFTAGWGAVEPAGAVNGSSGRWVDECILTPLRVTRDQTWMTYCLDTYRAGRAQIDAVADRFAPFAERNDLAEANLPEHPSEAAIVRDALAAHFTRLTTELREAQPTTIVTLGNAALRVMRELVDGADALEPWLDVEPYGRRLLVAFEGRSIAWYPVVHPRGRGPVKQAHADWMLLRSDPVAVARRGVCPACHGQGLVPILYGMPVGDALDDARRGRIAIGGCVITGEDPEQSCIECGASTYADGSFDISEW